MADRKLNYISFSEMREIVTRLGGENGALPYMKDDIGMLFGKGLNLGNILQKGIPYVMEEPRMGLVINGNASLIMNMMPVEVRENTLVFVGKGTVVQLESFSENFETCGIMMSNERFSRSLFGAAPPDFALRSACSAVETSRNEAEVVYSLLGILWQIIHENRPADDAINGLIHSLLYYCDSLHRRNSFAPAARTPGARQMFDRFIALVNEHSREQHALDFYADKMCVSRRYLGVAVKQASGIGAKEWLDRSIATSAKVLLRHTDKRINEISDALHFPNAAFFCKFFRRMTGQSPQTYRQER